MADDKNTPASTSWMDRFIHFSRGTATMVGHPFVFLIAVAVVLLWAVSGPLFGFSATWQLVINTGTTIVTFLMVFLIQSTQNRDSQAMHLKLDALIDGFDQVREDMVAIEHAPEDEIQAAEAEFERLREAGAANGAVEVAEQAVEVAHRAKDVAVTAGTVAATAADRPKD